MREIAPVVLHDAIQPRADAGVGPEESRLGGLQLLDELQGRIDPRKDRAGGGVGVLGEQLAQRHARGPARQGVVGDVDQAARLQLAPQELDDVGPVLGGDPAVDAVQSDDVELRQARLLGEILEALVEELDVRGAGLRRQRAGVEDVRGVEVGGEDLGLRIGRGDQIGRESLAAAELAIGQRRAGGGAAHTLGQGDQAQKGGCELTVEPMGIADIGHVTGRPGRHSDPPNL